MTRADALAERQTAGNRIRVETLWNGCWKGSYTNALERMIQELADEGYNFAGKIDEQIPTGTIAPHIEDFLFIKASE